MAGIFGVIHHDGGPVKGTDLDEMALAFPSSHGGKTATISRSGFVGFGYASADRPLLAHDDSGCMIAFVGVIRNRSELKLELGLPNDARRSDAELALAAYHRSGQGGIKGLVGEFALALWDPQASELLCVRDPFGICPFYYYRSPRSFIFSNEILPILQLREVPRTVNEYRVAELLTESFVQEEATFFRDVLRLPPGHLMSVKKQGVRVRRYWSPEDAPEVRYRSELEYAEAFRDLFTEAVRCRLALEGTTGVTLSGGLDSSSVMCMAGSLVEASKLIAFSAIYPEFEESDERDYIQAVLRNVNPIWRSVRPSEHSTVAERAADRFNAAEPIFWPTWCMEKALFDAAEESGTSILLTGHGGDHVLSKSTTGFYQELIRKGRWIAVLREARKSANIGDAGLWFRLWSDFMKPFLRTAAPRSFMRPRRRASMLRSGKLTRLNPSFVQRSGFDRRLLQAAEEKLCHERSRKHYHAHLLSHPQTHYGLDLISVVTSRYSFQMGHPFWDRRLVEFCYGIPREFLNERDVTGKIMRTALADVLPREISARTSKAFFDPIVIQALRDHDSEWLRDQLSNADLISQWIDVSRLRYILNRFLDHKQYGQRTEERSSRSKDDAGFLMAAATVISWLRRMGMSN